MSPTLVRIGAALGALALLAILAPEGSALVAYDTAPPSYGIIDSTEASFPYAPYDDLDPADPAVRVHEPAYCPAEPTNLGFEVEFYSRRTSRAMVFAQGFLTFDILPCVEGIQILSATPAGCASNPSTCTSYTERRLYCPPTAASCSSTFGTIGWVNRNYSGGTLTSSSCSWGSAMSNGVLTTAPFNQLVAAAMNNRLTPPAPECGQGGRILSKVEGLPGDRVLRIQWQDIRIDVCCTYPRQSFQVSLFERDSHIEVNYRTLSIPCCLAAGGGIENREGLRGFDYLGATRTLVARTVAYYPKPPLVLESAPDKACVGRPTHFHAQFPTAPALGGLSGLSWNWGDGSTSSGSDPTKTYAKRDNYTAVARATFGNDLAFDYSLRVRTYNCIPPVARFDVATGDASDATPRDLSEDPDGAVVDWLWDFGDGTVVRGRDPGPHHYPYAEVYPITLTVTDTEGFTDTAVVRVPVHGPPHYIGPFPVADAGPDQRAGPGAPVTLDGSGGDAHRAVRLGWTQVGGPPVSLTNPDSPRPSFTAPELEEGLPVQLTFALTLYDGHYTSEPDLVTVVVAPPEGLPRADAGPDLVAAPGALVTLDARRSTDPDLDPLAFRWSQVGGPRVELREPASASPSFLAPQEPAQLSFRLVASDGAGEASDTVAVAVVEAAGAPGLPGFAQQRVPGRPGAVAFRAPDPLLASVARHVWDFGDGTALQEGREVTHTYAAGGTYEVAVTALDAAGNPLYTIPGEMQVYLPSAGGSSSNAPTAQAPGAGVLALLSLVAAALACRGRRAMGRAGR